MPNINAGRDLIKFILDYTRGNLEEGLQAVLDARQFNTTISEEADTIFAKGKKRKLFINYYPPICSDDGTSSNTVCDSGTQLELQQAYFEISQSTHSETYALNKDDIRPVDNMWTFSTHAMQAIKSVLPTLRGKLATDVIELIVANAGLLPDGNAAQLLPWMDKNTGAANPMGLWDIDKTYRDSGYSNPFIVGGGDIFYWKKAIPIGTGNDDGQDIGRLPTDRMYYDTRVNTAYANPNSEHIVTFDPQMLKFVTYSDNAGLFATDVTDLEALDRTFAVQSPQRIYGSFIDPVTGLVWDLDVKWDDELNNCKGGWTFKVNLQWDIFFMPTPICNDVEAVNGIFHFTTCPQLRTTCPEGSVIAPVDSSTFAVDTNGVLTFPEYIHTLTIAGFETHPNDDVANLAALVAMMNENAPTGYVFSAVGTEIRYTGYAAITAVVNGTTLTFA